MRSPGRAVRQQVPVVEQRTKQADGTEDVVRTETTKESKPPVPVATP